MGFFSELWEFTKARKKLVLLPVIIVSLLVGVLLVFASGSVVSPFLYTMF